MYTKGAQRALTSLCTQNITVPQTAGFHSLTKHWPKATANKNSLHAGKVYTIGTFPEVLFPTWRTAKPAQGFSLLILNNFCGQHGAGGGRGEYDHSPQ